MLVKFDIKDSDTNFLVSKTKKFNNYIDMKVYFSTMNLVSKPIIICDEITEEDDEYDDV